MRQLFIRVAGVILCALALSGCVDSAGPLLSEAQPVLGERLRLQFYSLSKGTADEPEQATYKWDRGAYQRTGGGMTDGLGVAAQQQLAGAVVAFSGIRGY